MKLSQLTAKPTLVLVTIDDEETITEFKEPLEFYTWDRQPLDVFMKLASVERNNSASIIEIVRTLILDENGKEILNEGNMLPMNVLMKAIGKVTDLLGN